MLRMVTVLLALAAGASAGCYSGNDLENKEPAPGEIGGECVAGACRVGTCLDGGICYDPADPCLGIYCGGHGTCVIDIDENTPTCQCEPGYNNELYAHFCTAGG